VEHAGGRIALDTEAEFRSAFRTLAHYPGLGHRRPDITSKPALFATVGRYVVVYRAEADRVVIFAILHGSRDVKSILEERVF
jgi:plasmid stabilization system protein ParE